MFLMLSLLSRAWREIELSIIVKCFDIYGFDKLKDSEESENIGESDEDDDTPLAYWLVLNKFMEKK